MNRDLLAGATDDDHALDLEPLAGERVGELACPLLAIAGLLDQPFAVASSRALAASVEHARLVEIPDAAHLMSMERPALFNALVLEFLATALA
jgi:pimeloyl-ACP methyl ester carboxylesterase